MFQASWFLLKKYIYPDPDRTRYLTQKLFKNKKTKKQKKKKNGQQKYVSKILKHVSYYW